MSNFDPTQKVPYGIDIVLEKGIGRVLFRVQLRPREKTNFINTIDEMPQFWVGSQLDAIPQPRTKARNISADRTRFRKR